MVIGHFRLVKQVIFIFFVVVVGQTLYLIKFFQEKLSKPIPSKDRTCSVVF